VREYEITETSSILLGQTIARQPTVANSKNAEKHNKRSNNNENNIKSSSNNRVRKKDITTHD